MIICPSASSARAHSPDAAASRAVFIAIMPVSLALFALADAAIEKCSSAFWRYPERR